MNRAPAPPLIGAVLISLCAFVAAMDGGVPPQLNKLCIPDNGALCTAIVNNCIGAEGACTTCTAADQHALCNGEAGTCEMTRTATGCGTRRYAQCDNLGGCTGWWDTGDACSLFECKY